jgi:hypothetical protein
MSIRENLNKNPKLGAGIAAAAVILGVAAMAMQLSGGRGGGSGEAFYTTDDGANWFDDDADKLPPFQHKGKEAVRAHVFKCTDGKTYVNHLERFTPDRQKLAQAAAEASRNNQPPPPPPAAARQTANWGLEVKKPGDAAWTPGSDLAKSSKIMQAKCPDGHDAVPVAP